MVYFNDKNGNDKYKSGQFVLTIYVLGKVKTVASDFVLYHFLPLQFCINTYITISSENVSFLYII